MKVSESLVASQICPLENSLSVSYNASKSYRNFMTIQLWLKYSFIVLIPGRKINFEY